MHGHIWELQEPGQPPLSLQDLIGPFAGTGWVHRPLFARWPKLLAASGIVLGSTQAVREERIAGYQTRSYPTFNCITSQGSTFFPPLSLLALFGHKEQCDMQTVGHPK